MALTEGTTLRAAELSDGQAFGRSGGALAAVTPHLSGGTDVPVADGGTGASTAAGARTNLGLGGYSTLTAPAKVYLKSPDGNYWQLSVDNTGVISTTSRGTSVPAIEAEGA